MDALKNGRPFVEGAVDEYLTTFAENLERFRITLDNSKEQDEQIADSIQEFAPFKNEFVHVALAIAQYASTNDMLKKLHRFFEQLLPYVDRPEEMNPHHSWGFDNFKFIVHELYLYTIAILIRYERFEFADRLLATPYYLSANASRGRDATTGFSAFRSYMESFTQRDRRLRRLSSRADLLKQRAESAGFDFKWLMQADFVLYLRGSMDEDYYARWWPETLVYATHAYGPMEVFARSRSASYFQEANKLLGRVSADDFKAHILKLHGDRQEVPAWQFERISPTVLSGADKIATIQ